MLNGFANLWEWKWFPLNDQIHFSEVGENSSVAVLALRACWHARALSVEIRTSRGPMLELTPVYSSSDLVVIFSS